MAKLNIAEVEKRFGVSIGDIDTITKRLLARVVESIEENGNEYQLWENDGYELVSIAPDGSIRMSVYLPYNKEKWRTQMSGFSKYEEYLESFVH